MGPPGSGKTSVSKVLSAKLGMPVCDIDNDHLEDVWKPHSVADKLAELGDDGFLKAESEACMSLEKTNTIISLTGSVPLLDEAFAHLRKDGVTIFLDVEQDDIVQRMEAMKVDRIVGQSTKSLKEILEYRTEIYENSYDIRVLVEKGATIDQIANQVIDQLNKDQRFFSTRDIRPEAHKVPALFFDTIITGLAKDRGLYFPNYVPSISLKQLDRLVDLSYEDRALRILEMFPLATLNPVELGGMIRGAYSSFTHPTNTLPLTHIEDNKYQLEEYHGPTASFKDLALQLTPKLFQAAINHSGQGEDDFLFVVATSGDTGSACLDGFGKHPNTPVVVLFPNGGVSKVQQAQMASCPGDVCVISVDSDFDFCQSLVKDIFNSPDLRKEFSDLYNVDLSSGNSINWGRLFPQIPYTFSAYLDLVKQGVIKMGEPMDLCVPTGNFGNILGGVLAKKMGLPVDRLLVACNENNILADFLETGVFDARDRKLFKTSTPSIDILLPSNLERFLYVVTDGNAHLIDEWFNQHAEKGYFELPKDVHSKIQESVYGGWADGAQCKQTIKDVHTRTGQLLDPHTAVGKAVADNTFPDKKNPVVIAGTAHFSKFPTAILDALGEDNTDSLSLHELFDKLNRIDTTTRHHPSTADIPDAKILHDTNCPADKDSIIQEIRNFLKARKANK